MPAAQKFTVFDNGLKLPWSGRVFMNPPYGRETPQWVARMIEHNNGILLVFSRTDAAWFQDCLSACSAYLFIKGRIAFVPGNENKHKVSTAGAGTAMFAFGPECAAALERMKARGFYVRQAA